MRGPSPVRRALLRPVVLALSCLALVLLARSPAVEAQQPTPPVRTLGGQDLVALVDEVSKEVEALRGWSFKQPVKKELTTVEATVEYLKRQVEQELPSTRAPLVQAFLRTIGLIPPDADLRRSWVALLENQVGGFYDTKSKSMHLVSRAGTPPMVERIVLAHELTHALDDQWVDLDTFVKERTGQGEDIGLVAQSVVEGSATALMMRYAARAVLAGKLNLASLQEYAKQEQERSKPFLEAPRYFSAMLASYICGAQFLAKGNLLALAMAPDDKAIGEALLAARKQPPQSSEQILHPDKYWNASTRDEPVRFDDDAAGQWLASPGRWVVHADTVGELLTAILTTRLGSRPDMMAMQSADAWTNAAAAGWGGDRFYLVASGDTRDAARQALAALKGAWVTAWDSAKDRDEFVAAVPAGSFGSGAVAQPVGNQLAVVFFGFDDTERGLLARQLAASPLKMTKGGKVWPVGGNPNQ